MLFCDLVVRDPSKNRRRNQGTENEQPQHAACDATLEQRTGKRSLHNPDELEISRHAVKSAIIGSNDIIVTFPIVLTAGARFGLDLARGAFQNEEREDLGWEKFLSMRFPRMGNLRHFRL